MIAPEPAQADADERAEDEAAYWHRQELVDKARAADTEALDGSGE